ncbi:MAG: DUF1599 domain-containing protein [Oscillospiraceae bacterium]|nr:DUF1599 domain-containing protein [Oscillospiraceae bacterium]
MLTSAEIDKKYMVLMKKCENIFAEKGMEYGATWAIYRWSSLVDQLWMKVKRIRTIEDAPSKIPDSVDIEYMALINYAIVFLIRLGNVDAIASSDQILENIELMDGFSKTEVMELYQKVVKEAFELYQAKNHDYNNAWQDMTVSSITDLIIVKVLRMRQIVRQISNQKKNLRYDDVEQQLFDIINYSIFALIKVAV